MTASDFFFISAGLGICIFIASWIFIFYKIIRLLKTAELEIKSARNTFRLSGLTLVSRLLGLIKGGEKK